MGILAPVTPSRFVHLLIIIAALLALPPAQAQSRSANPQPPAGTGVEVAFQNFWAADSPAEAGRLATEIEKTGVTFDEALRRLKLGRTYTIQDTGIIQLKNRTEDG